jgi:hypothetical protein
MALAKWVEVDDSQVRMIYKCTNPNCHTQSHKDTEICVSPEYFQKSGTPFCMYCSEDLEYCRTEVSQIIN